MTDLNITLDEKGAKKLAAKFQFDVVPVKQTGAMQGFLSGENGLYVSVEKTSNPIAQLKAHFSLARRLKRLRSKYLKANGESSKLKLVFSHHDRPIAIFDHDSMASDYAGAYILPGLGAGVVGLIKRLIDKWVGINPAIDGALLLPAQAGESLLAALKDAELVEYDKQKAMSSICIDSSKDIFLFFGKQQNPELACYFISPDQGPKIKRNREQLYDALGDLVSRPLGVIKTESNRHAFVESGLPGCPWFQLLRNKQTSFTETKRVAVSMLNQFHLRVATNDLWHESQNLAHNLSEQYKFSASNNSAVASLEKLRPLVESSIASLDSLEVDSFYQHGDFCINNLLFLKDSAQIIDWDEFGHTSMPLQDEICLALSFHNVEGKKGVESLRENMILVMENSYWRNKLPENAFAAMFLYHLLYRLGEWGNNPNRAGICDWLLTILNEFIESPSELFLWVTEPNTKVGHESRPALMN